MPKTMRRSLWAATVALWGLTATGAFDPRVSVRLFIVCTSVTMLASYTAVQAETAARRDTVITFLLQTVADLTRPEPDDRHRAHLRQVR